MSSDASRSRRLVCSPEAGAYSNATVAPTRLPSKNAKDTSKKLLSSFLAMIPPLEFLFFVRWVSLQQIFHAVADSHQDVLQSGYRTRNRAGNSMDISHSSAGGVDDLLRFTD